MSRTILIVDDDKKIVNLVALYLKNEGYQVLTAFDGEEALDQAYRGQPDLIILDWMLPKISGLEVCEVLRQRSNVPVIMLTARTAEEDTLTGLHTGADDYVPKPFSPRELMARVQAVLRRSDAARPGGSAASATFGALTIHFVRHEVSLNGQVVNLTPTEYRLLEVMAREPGRGFSRRELLDAVFGYDYEGLERTVDVHMMNLRRKIKAQPETGELISTIAGYGYRLEG